MICGQYFSIYPPTNHLFIEYFFRLFEGSHQIHGAESITEDSAKILLQRGLKRVSSSSSPQETEEDKWEFTRDLKHRVAALYGYPQEVIRKLASEVKCPHLIVKAIQGNLYEVSYRFIYFLAILSLYCGPK